jgi:hypothetical protein
MSASCQMFTGQFKQGHTWRRASNRVSKAGTEAGADPPSFAVLTSCCCAVLQVRSLCVPCAFAGRVLLLLTSTQHSPDLVGSQHDALMLTAELCEASRQPEDSKRPGTFVSQ